MKKVTFIFMFIALIFGIQYWVDARLTGTAPSSPDAFCVGRSANEVCVDYSGNLLNTTNSSGDLGTSSLKWEDLYLDGDITADDITVGDITATGDTTLVDIDSTGDFTITGQFNVPIMSTTSIAALVTVSTGSMVFNATDVYLCISTASNASSWVQVATVTSSCY